MTDFDQDNSSNRKVSNRKRLPDLKAVAALLDDSDEEGKVSPIRKEDQHTLFRSNEELLQTTARIKNQRDLIKSRLTKMETSRPNVSRNVFDKVYRDYSLQLESISHLLNEKKGLLKKELKNLYLLLEKKTLDVNRHKEILEEAQFRHYLEEFSEEQFKEVQEYESREIMNLQSELSQVHAMIRIHEELFDPEDLGYSSAGLQALSENKQPSPQATQTMVQAPITRPPSTETQTMASAIIPTPPVMPPPSGVTQASFVPTPSTPHQPNEARREPVQETQAPQVAPSVPAATLPPSVQDIFADLTPPPAEVAVSSVEIVSGQAPEVALPPPIETSFNRLTDTVQNSKEPVVEASAQVNLSAAQTESPAQVSQELNEDSMTLHTEDSLGDYFEAGEVSSPSIKIQAALEKSNPKQAIPPLENPQDAEEEPTTPKGEALVLPEETPEKVVVSEKTIVRPQEEHPQDDPLMDILNDIPLEDEVSETHSQTVSEASVKSISRPGVVEQTGKAQAYKLVFIESDGPLDANEFVVNDNVSIGRSPSNDLVLKAAKVSRQHAAINKYKDQYLIIDLKSSNGVFVNGKKIDEHALQDGDEISIGGYKMIFKKD